MSTARLTFLYPHLFRSVRLAESSSAAATAAAHQTKAPCRKPSDQRRRYAAFSNSARANQASFERHGKAVEPIPVTPESAKLPQSDKGLSSDKPKPKPEPKPAPAPHAPPKDTKPSKPIIGEKFEAKGRKNTKATEQPKASVKETEGPPKKEATAAAAGAATAAAGTATVAQEQDQKEGSSPGPDPGPASTASAQARQEAEKTAEEERMRKSGPMEVVLHMPPPGEAESTAESPNSNTPQHHHNHPLNNFTPTRYMHHFDTYTLVKQLETGGYTNEQAVTLMKAVRILLADNLDMAQDGLVSKRDVDNETYLFNAACSELSAEVKKNRRVADENTRQQRTLLQHEVDIITQRMSQDLQTLKDDVKGMFNDRKMTVREEQRNMESQIQQINLKISVLLNSDAKSDIESLRWILIRRSVLGILFMAVMTLAMLRYTTYVGQKRQREADEAARHAEQLRHSAGKEDRAPPVDAARILAAN